MPKQSVETELLSLEKRYWTAIREKDPESALELTHDPCLITGAQGVSQLDHKTFAKIMANPPGTLDHFELDEVKVRMVGDDVALIAYKIKESLTVDGEPLELEAADSSTWVRSGGRWLCAMHSEAIAGDRFGRDRKAAS